MGVGDLLSGVGSALTGVASVGSLFGGGDGGAKERDFWNKRAWKHTRDVFTQGLQYRVADAKKAGIHPLYAIGASMNASPSFQMGSGPEAGSAFSRGLGAVGEAAQGVGEAFSRSSARRAAQESHDASVGLTNAQAAYYHALRRKTEQDIMSAGSTPGTPNGELSPRTFPVALASSITSRPVQVEPYVNAPEWNVITRPDGSTYKQFGRESIGEDILDPRTIQWAKEWVKNHWGSVPRDFDRFAQDLGTRIDTWRRRSRRNYQRGMR